MEFVPDGRFTKAQFDTFLNILVIHIASTKLSVAHKFVMKKAKFCFTILREAKLKIINQKRSGRRPLKI